MKLVSSSFRAMGSPCELRLYARDPALAQQAEAAARAAIARLEARYSRYQPDSLTTRVNQTAGTDERIKVDDETAGLLDYATQAWEQSDGLFDITSGVLRRVWDFRSQRLPTQQQIATILPLIGWGKVEWQKPWLRLPVKGMELDFGGYVKEYAADVAAAACRGAGIQHGLVELGGDIRVIGPHPDGSPWRVGVRNPRAPDVALAMVDLLDGAIASSGDYERCMVVDGKRYGHVLNPRTGWPVKMLAAVSVLAPQCLIAGTATTVAMLKEVEGPAWLAELGLPHLGVTHEGRVFGSLATQAGIHSETAGPLTSEVRGAR
jgi:thiamine biosynthesis lipoprotein